MLGIDNLVKLATSLGEGGTILHAVLEDGRISLRDLGEFRHVIDLIKGLLKIDYKSLLPEIKDLDDAEKDALTAAFKASLKIDAGTREETIEAGFSMLLDVISLVVSFTKWGEKP